MLTITDPLEIELVDSFRKFMSGPYNELYIKRHQGEISIIERERVKTFSDLR